MIKDKCSQCHGTGTQKIEKTIKVTIPAGIEDATRMRVAGAGEAGFRGSLSGDLYIFISVKEHPLYEREGENLYTTVPVSMTCAALGGKIEIPGIDGQKIEIEIKEGTQSGSQIRAKGQGMPFLKSTRRGDLYVTLKVETPTHLSKKEKELLQQFREISGNDDCQPETKSFFDKLKDLWG